MPGWTLQTLIDERMTLRACCRSNHIRKLDLDALKAKLGPDARAMAGDLLPKLVCSKCA